MKYDIATEETSEVFATDWDIAYAYFSHGGKYRVMLINEDGKNVLQIWDTEAEEALDVESFQYGDISSVSISRDEEMMRFYVGSSATPSDLYVYDLNDGAMTQLTDVMNPEIERTDLVEAEVIRFFLLR